MFFHFFMISLIHPCQKRALIPLKFEVVFNYNTFFKVAQSYPHGPKLAKLTVPSFVMIGQSVRELFSENPRGCINPINGSSQFQKDRFSRRLPTHGLSMTQTGTYQLRLRPGRVSPSIDECWRNSVIGGADPGGGGGGGGGSWGGRGGDTIGRGGDSAASGRGDGLGDVAAGLPE